MERLNGRFEIRKHLSGPPGGDQYLCVDLLAESRPCVVTVREGRPIDGLTAFARMRDLFRDRYLLLFFFTAGMSFTGIYLMDYIFYDQTQIWYQTEEALASFLGIFFGVVAATVLVTKMFLSSRMLSRYGLGFGLFAVPVALLAGLSGSLILGQRPSLATWLFGRGGGRPVEVALRWSRDFLAA